MCGLRMPREPAAAGAGASAGAARPAWCGEEPVELGPQGALGRRRRTGRRRPRAGPAGGRSRRGTRRRSGRRGPWPGRAASTRSSSSAVGPVLARSRGGPGPGSRRRVVRPSKWRTTPLEAVERDQDRVGEDPERVFQGRVDAPLVLEPLARRAGGAWAGRETPCERPSGRARPRHATRATAREPSDEVDRESLSRGGRRRRQADRRGPRGRDRDQREGPGGRGRFAGRGRSHRKVPSDQ